MKDIRILTLQKQYYLDSYTVPMECQYSTWGYYDGISIKQIDETKEYSQLFKKRSKAPISQIWYSTGEQNGTLQGRFGNQNIGVFRCVSESEEERVELSLRFWEKQSMMPFFSLGFLQLNNRKEYEAVSRKIEKRGNSLAGGFNREQCEVLVYCTYDNADLVVLLHSNSVIKMEETLRDIEAMPDILYMHSILGVSEEYLAACNERMKILRNWRNTTCFVDDSVMRLDIRGVTSGSPEVITELKSILDISNDKWDLKGFDKVTYSYITGHENICITFRDTDIKSLLALLVPGGFATHQNPVYGRGVYNIETSVAIKEEPWGKIPGNNSSISNNNEKPGMCRTLLDKYRKIQSEVKENDESLYSYYQALMHTINTLDQYENYKMSQNIFWMLFPAVSMFDKLLDRAWKRDDIDYYEKTESIKKSIKRFLESVNSVIYHTIHTDQIFLMVPGYSGTPFSIPIKLSLMYLWFIDKTIDILNDSNHKYSCILAPEMESRPVTNIISFGLPPEDRLILVQMSQRSLFLPRNLMVVLNHEIGHYVSGRIRSRWARLEGISVTLAYFIAEYIFPEEYDGNPLNEKDAAIFEVMKSEIKTELQIDALNFIQKNNKKQFDDEEKVHANVLSEKLYDAVWNYIGTVDKQAHKIIFSLPPNIRNIVEENEEEFTARMRYIYKVQRKLDINRTKMLGDKRIIDVIERLINIYREVFSDVASIVTLNIDEEDFKEAFQISEGIKITEGNKPEEQALREKIVNALLSKKIIENRVSPYYEYGKKARKTLENFYSIKGNMQDRVIENLLFYCWMQRELLVYAETVYQNMEDRVNEECCCKSVKQVRTLFELFKGQPGVECSEIYRHINDIIISYGEKRESEHQRWIDINCT